MVLNEVQPKLSTLKPLARELNEASDAFTQELKAIEDELGALGLGVEAESGPIATSVVMDDDTPDPTSAVRLGRVTYLAYGRDSHGWALFVRRYRLVSPDSLNGGAPIVSAIQTALGVKVKALESTQRLLSASRDLRLAAANHIPALLDNLAEAARVSLQAVKKVVPGPSLSRLGRGRAATAEGPKPALSRLGKRSEESGEGR
jgi:hypothetical protein